MGGIFCRTSLAHKLRLCQTAMLDSLSRSMDRGQALIGKKRRNLICREGPYPIRYSWMCPPMDNKTEYAISFFASHCVQRIFSALCCVGLMSLLMTACRRAPQVSTSASPDGEWHDFQGTWIAAGSRNMMGLGGDRRAAVSSFDGSLVLAGPSRPGVGFRSEAIVFSDTVTGLIGRAVWTDEHGDRVYSELRGEGSASNNKIIGTFVGGTGRYSGATGSYEFSWRFVLEDEDGAVQGQSLGLRGRVRVDNQQAGSAERARRS